MIFARKVSRAGPGGATLILGGGERLMPLSVISWHPDAAAINRRGQTDRLR